MLKRDQEVSDMLNSKKRIKLIELLPSMDLILMEEKSELPKLRKKKEPQENALKMKEKNDFINFINFLILYKYL